MEPTLSNVKKVIEKSLDVVLPDSKKNLFDLGVLDSLRSVNLILDLEKSFKVKLSVLDLADNEAFTLIRLTQMIEKRRITSPSL